MNLLVFYGGTFDPVHEGHLSIARAAHVALRETIALVPAADPPHRPSPGASAPQRADMLDLAVAGEPGLCVDRRELARDAASYTIDTLHDLRLQHGREQPIAWLLGADSFRGLPEWKRWRELLDCCHFVVADRAGSPLDDRLAPGLADALRGRWTHRPDDLKESPAGRVLRLEQPLHPASATAIRRAIARGLSWREDVPPAVADYIQRHRLYRDGSTPDPSL
ncbi:nicotinate-nucleotide adenylyltransferase [Luteimonas vadosa]|uniref:Probable nicotinate-nucleotide adenylyltransferase n=1 Tax=Luteimonas vadosa TaxID=1165507 RepID=A0ABP9E542_9GAMM